MIKQEILTNGFVRTYSDMGYEIKSLTSGDVFLEAVDAPEWNAEYEEIIPPRNDEQVDVINFISGQFHHQDNIDKPQLFLVKNPGFG